MEEFEKVALSVKTTSSDDENWEDRIKKFNWTKLEHTLFDAVTNVLDQDHLARLANKDRPNEPVLRRSIIDKSVSRLRKALTKVGWSLKLIQWIHVLLMDNLSPSYMACYLDILQTLKSKVPALADRLMFGRPINQNQDILGPVLKRAWEPQVTPKVNASRITQNVLSLQIASLCIDRIVNCLVTQSSSLCHRIH